MAELNTVAVYAPAPNTERGKQTRLTTGPQGDKIVYASGNSIIIRSIVDPMDVDIYTRHKSKTTVGRISPSGYYCASADTSGNVFIWGTKKDEHILKYEKKSFSNGVLDLQWTEDSKRICCVGNGKELKAECFMYDSGTSTGEITGHTGVVLGCAVRQKRPYRIATCGEDSLMNFYKGPPFKFEHSNREHTRFVNCVEYSPDGEIIATGGGDKKIFFYDGTEGKFKAELKADEDNKNPLKGGAHKLSVLSLSFARDGKTLFSCSADKTVKLWDVETQKYKRTMYVREALDPKEIELTDTPVGVTCTNYGAVVCTLRGDLCLFDDRVEGYLPVSIMRANSKAISSISVLPVPSELSEEEKLNRVDFVAASNDGQVVEYNLAKGPRCGTKGFPFDGQILVGATEGNGNILSISPNGLNVTESPVAFAYPHKFDPSKNDASGLVGIATPAPSSHVTNSIDIPRGISLLNKGEHCVVISKNRVLIFTTDKNADGEVDGKPSKKVVAESVAEYGPVCVATHSEKNLIVVGGNDHYVHFYKFDKDAKTLTEYAKSKGRYDGVVSAVAISPSGELFAASRDRFLCVGPTAESELSKPDLKLQENRLLHTAKITSLDFSPDNTHLLSGGIDCQVFIWDADNQDKFDRILNVHAPLGITQVKYVDNERFLTAGSDGVIRLWGK